MFPIAETAASERKLRKNAFECKNPLFFLNNAAHEASFPFASENASLLKIVVGKKVPKVEVGGLKVAAEKPQISTAGVLSTVINH